MERALTFVARSLPLIFAFAFLAPVLDKVRRALGLEAPFGLSTLVFGLIVAGIWGLIAQITGRWL